MPAGELPDGDVCRWRSAIFPKPIAPKVLSVKMLTPKSPFSPITSGNPMTNDDAKPTTDCTAAELAERRKMADKIHEAIMNANHVRFDFRQYQVPAYSPNPLIRNFEPSSYRTIIIEIDR